MLLALGWLAALPVAAQTQATPPALTGEDIDRLTSLLQDETRRAEFLRTLEALSAASRARAGTAGEGSLPEPGAPRPAAPPEAA
ncbi:MAG: mechanosensitive ion channel protein MscS, partial [Acetobacteraceae bacterium]|nr:mechanosensitive ion channel protein MscS [Acetobacteraceae bacterium]